MAGFPIYGLFHKMFAGDDALLHLAATRFAAAGMGAEIQAGSAGSISRELAFVPPQLPVACHLPRGLNLMDGWWPGEIVNLAARFAGRLRGFIVHDQLEAAYAFPAYVDMLRRLDDRLQTVANPPLLFIEYAAGLDPDRYCEVLAALQDRDRVSGCADIGHLGVHAIRHCYAGLVPSEDPCRLDPGHHLLPERIEAIAVAVAAARPRVIDLIGRIASLGKPLHFHLHDCHPLSFASPYGVCDHLSFLATIPLPFAFQGRREMPLLYGPEGLKEILLAVRRHLDWQKLSLSLEIHPAQGKLALGNFLHFFQHWRNRVNAERMHAWLDMLTANARLLTEACQEVDRAGFILKDERPTANIQR